MSRGVKTMYRNLRSTLGVALCLLSLMSPLVLAAEQPSKPLPAAQLIAVEGASHTYHLIDYDKRVVTADVPAQDRKSVDVGKAYSTGRATILSIELTTNRVKARTDVGQVLVLAMAHAVRENIRIGDTYTLAVRQVVLAAEQPSKPLPAAQLIAVEGASHTYHLIDYDKRVVTADVPA